MYSKLLLSFLGGSFIGCGGAYIASDTIRDKPLILTPQHSSLSTHEQSIYHKSLAALKFGIPEAGHPIILNDHYMLQYDQFHKIPLWVSEHITREQLEGNANRKNCKFTPDERLPETFQSKNEDFWKSGFSRGHMAAAGNYKHSSDAMSSTFYLSNIIPQNYNNNAGYWNRMEMHVRTLAKEFGEVIVFSGPLFLPEKLDSGKLQLRYPVIGENQLSVPTHLYKLIIVEKPNEDPMVGAFIIPNLGIKTQPLTNFQVPLEELVKQSGISFLSKLKKYSDLCQSGNCQLLSDEKFHLYITQRNLSYVETLSNLDREWNRLLKEVKPTPEIVEIYENKKKEIIETKDSQNKLEASN